MLGLTRVYTKVLAENLTKQAGVPKLLIFATNNKLQFMITKYQHLYVLWFLRSGIEESVNTFTVEAYLKGLDSWNVWYSVNTLTKESLLNRLGKNIHSFACSVSRYRMYFISFLNVLSRNR